MMVDHYSASFADAAHRLWVRIATTPDLEIQVVAGLAALCLQGCPLKNACCESEESNIEDRLLLRVFDLEVGRIYPARELLRKMGCQPLQ